MCPTPRPSRVATFSITCPCSGGSLGILVGDVSGHGLPAALLMASTQAYLRCLAQTCTTVGEIMTRVNRFVHGETDFEHFVTLLLDAVQPAHPADWSSPMPAILPATCLTPRVTSSRNSKAPSFPLGVTDHVDYPVREPTTLEVGDMVVLLTDGFLEAESPDGGVPGFGADRVLETIRGVLDRPSQEILETLHQAIISFTGKPLPADDLTAVIVKIER